MSLKTAPDQPVSGSRPWSLATRLTVWYGASAFLLIALSTAFLYWALVSNLDREDDEFLVDKVHLIRSLLRDRPDDRRLLSTEVTGEPAPRQFGQIHVRIMNEDGTTLLETPGMSSFLSPTVFPAPSSADGGLAKAREVDSPDSRSFRVLAARAVDDGAAGRTRTIHIAMDRTHEEALLRSYRRWLWLVLGTALVVSIFAGFHIARRGLRPLADITETARRVRSTTLHERIHLNDCPAELAELAATLNGMLDRLEDSFDRLARFSADIAHELRNPVNNFRGEAEVALGKPRSPEEYREVLSSSLEECGRLSRLIDSLLFVARAESPETQITKEPVDVGQELTKVQEFYEAAAAEARVDLVVTAPRELWASVDRTLFHRALGNLVSNALAHTSATGSITLIATGDKETIRVQVADTGAGISPQNLPHVFDRFYRADRARSAGSGRVGLGLAIVKSIMALHRGSAAIASQEGRGTCVTLVFPLEQGKSL